MSGALLCRGRYCIGGAIVLGRLCGGLLWLDDCVGSLVSGLFIWGVCVGGAIMLGVLFCQGCYCCRGAIVSGALLCWGLYCVRGVIVLCHLLYFTPAMRLCISDYPYIVYIVFSL